ncbi:MAG: cation:dicarboxylase symporter family transporter, partial [Balneolaceae bacterium]
MKWYRKLHWQIIIGLILGLVWGLVASAVGSGTFTTDYISPFGTIFVNLLKMIAVPLVLASLVVGVTNLNDMRKLSRMGGKTIAIYMVTTTFAITIGLATVHVMQPGKTLPDETRLELMTSYQEAAGGRDQQARELLERSPIQFLVDVVPENVVKAASNNSNMLQVVFIA